MVKIRGLFLQILGIALIFVLLSAVFIAIMYLEAIKKGMPVKRWLLLAGLLGPVAWCLFNLHYRRALLRSVGINPCIWRP
ncbi:hypothetical protein [Pseudoalteromonas sp. JB197]|uniref:hypothetical protein n=1 Tax=Pseudoalteromonas sp. JB197 TaxID=1434839 RepID=UPI000B34D220|nr:hypothetical protein CIK86_03295 [Pseudoalteromonas sp. JB197]